MESFPREPLEEHEQKQDDGEDRVMFISPGPPPDFHGRYEPVECSTGRIHSRYKPDHNQEVTGNAVGGAMLVFAHVPLGVLHISYDTSKHYLNFYREYCPMKSDKLRVRCTLTKSESLSAAMLGHVFTLCSSAVQIRGAVL